MSSSIVDRVSAITAAIAVYGAFISTILLYLKYKENKIDIRITISKIGNDPYEHLTYKILA